MTSAVLISAPQSEIDYSSHLPQEVLVLAAIVEVMLMRMILVLLVR